MASENVHALIQVENTTPAGVLRDALSIVSKAAAEKRELSVIVILQEKGFLPQMLYSDQGDNELACAAIRIQAEAQARMLETIELHKRGALDDGE